MVNACEGGDVPERETMDRMDQGVVLWKRNGGNGQTEKKGKRVNKNSRESTVIKRDTRDGQRGWEGRASMMDVACDAACLM